MKYLVRSYGPPVITDFPFRLQRSIEFAKTAEEQPLEAEKRTTRTVGQELRRGLLGLKVTPFNIERERAKREREMRLRLQELLIGAGVLKEFKRAYIPKEKPVEVKGRLFNQ